MVLYIYKEVNNLDEIIIYKSSEFAKKLGVTPRTLQNWEKEGFLIPHRNKTGRKFYTEEQYKQYLENTYNAQLQSKETPEIQINLSLRTEESKQDFIVEIQHLQTKEWIEIKRLKTYKNANAQLNKKKKEYEDIGITVNVVRRKNLQGGNENEL